MTNAGILGIVVNELYYEKKPCLIILLEIDKSSEIGFHCTILPFSLAICLQVEGGGEFSLNAKEIA